MFGTQKPTGIEGEKKGLFGVNSTSKGLFGGTKNLFSGPSLFSGVSKFTKAEDQKLTFISSKGEKVEEDEEEDKEDEDDKRPSFIAVSKDPYVKIFNRSVERFMTKTGDKGNGHLSIETGDTDGKKFVLINFRNPIGKTLFTGQIVAACKKAKALDKPGKIQSKLTVLEKDPKTGSLTPMPLLITFIRTDDLNEFDKQWDEAKKLF